MAVQSNLKNMFVCLFGTCLVCSALLAGVYAMTKAPIDATNARLLKEAVGAVLPEGGELSDAQPLEVGGQPSEFYTLTDGGAPAAYAVKSTVVGFGGPLTHCLQYLRPFPLRDSGPRREMHHGREVHGAVERLQSG